MNHACVHRNRTTTANVACGSITFCRHLPKRQKGGKAYAFENSRQLRVKASTKEARGSGFHEAYLGTFVVKPAREKVNPAETTEPGKTSLLNAHSVSALKLRDRSSAETLDVPGICAELTTDTHSEKSQVI